MSKINKIAKRKDYQQILSLTFISNEKKNAKEADENMRKQFQEEMTHDEFNEKCTGIEKNKINLETQEFEMTLEIP